MKLTSVELHPANSSEVAVLSFRDPTRKNPYNVRAIVGLDADEIVPRYYGVSGSSAKFYSLSLEKRNIVVRISLNPSFALNQSYSDLRDALYKLIASSRTGSLQLRFKNGTTVVAAISGFVTKLEAPNFDREQEVQITIRCDEPMLKALARVDVFVGSLDPALTEIEDTLSTAPHGFIFDLEVLSNIASLTIEDPNDDSWSYAIVPAGGFLTGDVISFSSELNNKYLYLLRAAVVYHLADVITLGSIWPILFPGENSLTLSNPTNVEWNSISYYPTYWGV